MCPFPELQIELSVKKVKMEAASQASKGGTPPPPAARWACRLRCLV